MTRNADRNNIKPVLFSIAFVMVVLFCLFGTIMAKQSIRAGQFAEFKGIFYSIVCFLFLGVLEIISLSCVFAFICLGMTFFSSPTFIAICITLFCSLAFFASLILLYIEFYTGLALRLKTIFISTLFVKFRKRFGLLALPAPSGYDCIRHNCFSSKQFCLEPIVPAKQGYSACSIITGQFYSSTNLGK